MSRTKKPGVNVVPRGDDRAVVRDGADRASRVFPTQREVIHDGCPIAQRNETELRIQDRRGRWRDSDSYGGDPAPPIDEKHEGGRGTMTITLTARGTRQDLPHHFAELKKNIEPPQQRRDAAASIPAQVRDFLEDSTEFPTEDPHSRLTGSYARSTAIHAIKDVDFVVFVDAEIDKDDEDPDPEAVLDDL